jgi:hypothetical protein
MSLKGRPENSVCFDFSLVLGNQTVECEWHCSGQCDWGL